MRVLLNNKKAYHEYEILDKYEAGIKLTGCELKSILISNASIAESFVDIKNGEAWLKQCHIDKYKMSRGFEEHDETRPRKLLLHKQEIKKLKKKVTEKGLTIVVLDVHYSGSKRVKVNIALARGKKLHDKREAIKKKDLERRG